MLSGRGLCDELITHPEESYQLCCVIVCDLETSRMGAPYIYDISRLRVNIFKLLLTLHHSSLLSFLALFQNKLGKGKAIPLQAWTGPEGARKLWHPDCKTLGT